MTPLCCLFILMRTHTRGGIYSIDQSQPNITSHIQSYAMEALSPFTWLFPIHSQLPPTKPTWRFRGSVKTQWTPVVTLPSGVAVGQCFFRKNEWFIHFLMTNLLIFALFYFLINFFYIYNVYFTRVCATPGLNSVTIHPDHLPCGILLLIRVASSSVSGRVLCVNPISLPQRGHEHVCQSCHSARMLASSAKSLLKAWENL